MPRVAGPIVLALAILAGCGGDGEPSAEDDEKAVRDVVTLSLTTVNHSGDCRRRLSSQLIRKTYRNRTRCVRVQMDDEEDPADTVRFSRVKVDGDRATAAIRILGGSSDGATGELELVREDGDWRIDDASVPLLRSLVEAGLKVGSGGLGLQADAVACMARELARLPDAEFRNTAYELIGETAEGEQRTSALLARCPGEGGRSLLFQVFEQGIVESLRKRGSSETEIRCVVSKLRADVTDKELAAAFTRGDTRKESARLITPALTACS
jgi:hypothetical protein